MTRRTATRAIPFAAALALSVGALAAAPEATSTGSGGAFPMPAVLGAAYHVPGVALGAAEVRSQGGLLVPNLTRWRRGRDASASAQPFRTPAAFTVAYRDPRIATDAAQVLKQGGFATAGVVRWLHDAPATVAASSVTVQLGAL
ncbi:MULTISPECIES: hypothetical protein [Methylobacterium]|uniref:Uncharacterized protein n=1 Tax=Methylobacterium longum TaxID=767694 RepID=A0ABT8AK33_9HYPH|nr:MULTISPECIES: hypothetical protein [Methylobacterium]MCJ2102899.1 hypothetical protein [Methylobacterium sp. E-046]MDN3570124.1 hypothetical protein [Methylobacterium longum]GJE12200.1 hypothetical protein FOHLNKBM_3247 [Methylobacterium longum]